ncbi:hypothetical protein HY994_03120 [Candidatus Micrarchaeota archaeon]|nr:hypothetical protein [Candidatus Micrarchaeota archaeon]
MASKRVFVVLVFLAAALGLILGSRPALLVLGELPELSFPDTVADYPVHWHARVRIVDGPDEIIIPANVGLPSDGPESPVHTHDESGVLHVEAHRLADLPPSTLAYFFSLWPQPLNASCVTDVCTDSTRQMRFFVNGAERLDWLTYDLADGDDIEFLFEPASRPRL